MEENNEGQGWQGMGIKGASPGVGGQGGGEVGWSGVKRATLFLRKKITCFRELFSYSSSRLHQLFALAVAAHKDPQREGKQEGMGVKEARLFKFLIGACFQEKKEANGGHYLSLSIISSIIFLKRLPNKNFEVPQLEIT